MKTDGIRLKHGQESESDPNIRFWAYQNGGEYWVTKEKYDQLTQRALENKRKRYKENPKAFLKKDKFYKINNYDRYLERSKVADKKRSKSQKRIEWSKSWRKKHKQENASFDIGLRLRIRIANALRRNKAYKSESTQDLLGCEWDFFIKWIESKFSDGMSWENRNQWHIDHIRPCRSFDLTDISQQRQCFHYTNLQPLWAKDNLSKGGKY